MRLSRSDRLSERFISCLLRYIPGIICVMCCTSYVFVMALKVKKASSAVNKALPTKKNGLNAPDQEQKFERGVSEVQPRQHMDDTCAA